MIPIETAGHTQDALIVVLGPDNIERMKSADPTEDTRMSWHEEPLVELVDHANR